MRDLATESRMPALIFRGTLGQLDQQFGSTQRGEAPTQTRKANFCFQLHLPTKRPRLGDNGL
jgi:hypothetical protein